MDNFLFKFSLVKRRLKSKECWNRGYILDGFPKTKKQASLLFEKIDTEEEDSQNGEEGQSADQNRESETYSESESRRDEENAEDDRIRKLFEETTDMTPMPKPQTLPKSILPASVIFLQASNAFLYSRALNLSLEEVEENHNDEEGFQRRLALYLIAYTGSKEPLKMVNEQIQKALDSAELEGSTDGDFTSRNSFEEFVTTMVDNVTPESLPLFFDNIRVPILNFDVSRGKSGVSSFINY